MRRALVTGAGGFLGRHMVRDLRDRNVRVTTLGRQAADGSHVALGELPWSVARVADAIVANEPDVIFHLAGTSVGSAAELEQVNVGISGTIMQALERVKRRPVLVCCGSATEYGTSLTDGVPARETDACEPVTAYGMMKFAQTMAALRFAEASGTPVVVARIFNPIGPGMPPHLALADFARQIAMAGERGLVLRTGNLDVARDFVDVSDVVMALCRLAENPDARGVVNVCSGKPTLLRDLAAMLIETSGKRVAIETAADRLRPRELAVVTGCAERLAVLGAMPPPTNFPAVIARLWADADKRRAAVS